MEENIKNFGRLRYIEPTLISKDGKREGLNDDFIQFPYEDYNMAVDLSIKIADRYSCGLSESTGDFKEYNYSSTNGTLSFLGGTKLNENDEKSNFLTTNFTDISMTNPETNTSECLGIKSINITYDSWMFPQVTINFVDVRGATVMQQAERAYYNSKDSGNSTPLYRALFSFPYPIFTLKVKGFYGKGVTYKLSPYATSMELDSATGNFNIVVKFIGQKFGIYSEIPMTFLTSAPYTQNGSSYWDSKINDGTFVFKDINGQPTGSMVKIPDLIKKISEVAKDLEKTKFEVTKDKTLNNYDEHIQSLKNIKALFPFNEWMESEDNTILYTYGDNENIKNKKPEIDAFLESLNSYDSAYGTKYINSFESLKNYSSDGNNEIKVITFVNEYEASSQTSKYALKDDENNKNYYNKYIKGKLDVENYIGKIFNKGNQMYIFILEKNSDISYKEIIEKKIKEDLSKLTKNKEKEDRIFKDKKLEMYEKVLGFRPSIQNMYNLVFAHMETFLHCFYATMKNIRQQLDTDKTKREKNNFEVSDENTDTERSTKSERGKYLPPFTGFYENNYENGTTKKELMWPGDLLNGETLEEVSLVKDLLYGSEIYGVSMSKVMNDISAFNENGDNSSGGTFNIDNSFIPLSCYDIVNRTIPNPYSNIKNKIDSGSEIEGEIFGEFLLRAYYYIATREKNKEKLASLFGKVESVNFFKGIGNNGKSNFINFIKKYTSNETKEYNEVENILKIAESTSFNEIAKAWQFGGNTNNNLFNLNGYSGYIYNLYKPLNRNGNIYLPLSFNGFEKIKDDFINDEAFLLKSNNYIVTNNASAKTPVEEKIIIGEIMEGGTFTLYEDNRIDTIFKLNKEDLLNNQETTDENGNTIGKYGKLTFTEYELDELHKSSICDRETFGTYGNIIFDKDENKYGVIPKENLDDYYIKYPSTMDEDETQSIFNSDIYKVQNNNLAKAYLFLQSLPLKRLVSSNGGIDYQSSNSVIAKSRLLREGSYYWRLENDDKIIIPNRYERPNIDETFFYTKSFRSELDAETFNILPNGKHNYFKWEVPKNATISRKEYLKKYFINWATDISDDFSFAQNAEFLSNVNLYGQEKEGDENSRSFSKGLDIKLVIDENKKTKNAENARKLQTFLRNLCFTKCTVVDYYNGAINNNITDFVCHKNELKEALASFLSGLKKIYGEYNDKEKLNTIIANESSNPYKSKDLKLSTYNVLKSLYDKWLCNYYNGENSWKLNSENGQSDFDNFVYIDSYYNKIGYKLPLNVDKISSWFTSCIPSSNNITIEGSFNYISKTVYEFLAETAQDVGGVLLAIPQMLGLKNEEGIKNMFTPISINENWDEDTSTFVFIYSYEPSQHLGDSETGDIDMNGWSCEGDGFNLTDEDIIGEIMGGNENDGYKVPGFGVTYGKQNQCMFKNITLKTENNGITEAAIAATQDIASKDSISRREITLYGQDLYRVYSKLSYTCGVESMGNVQITPLMYFQLNNIPLWKGAYMIKKVSHDISIGDITTTFEGIRQNKFAIPIASCEYLLADTNQNTYDLEILNEEKLGISTENSTTINDSGNKDYNVNFTIDFNETNVSKETPIICLIPGHGPKTEKALEWAWASKLIDEYIIPKLKTFKYSNGKPYNIQRCNKNGNNTYVKGYSTCEIQKLINKYGSENVVSVAIHWNGGAGSRFEAYVSEPSRYKKNVRFKLSDNPRKDSYLLANCMKSSADKISNTGNRGEYNEMPSGFMNGSNNVMLLDNNNSDGGPRLNCACVLTENWYADYPLRCNWDIESKYQEKKDNKYSTGRGWMSSNEGLNAIAEANANGIKSYIDSLSENKNI